MKMYCRMWVRLVGFYRMRVRAFDASNKNQFQSQCLFNSKHTNTTTSIRLTVNKIQAESDKTSLPFVGVYRNMYYFCLFILFVALFSILVLNTFSLLCYFSTFLLVSLWNCCQCCRIAKVCARTIKCHVWFHSIWYWFSIKCKYWFGISTNTEKPIKRYIRNHKKKYCILSHRHSLQPAIYAGSKA